jgi:YVTN family beta-propeller protein
MKTTILKTVIAAMALTMMVSSCKKDPSPDTNSNSATASYGAGVFIVNEGVYSTGTGTVSYLNRSTKVITNDIFQSANSRPLGNVAQSMAIYNGKGYIVVNNAQKVEVVTLSDFKSLATITGLTSPRYFKALNPSKAYITDMTGYVAVINLNHNSITKLIQTGRSPETMVLSGNYLYVANFGGFGTDSTISVINTQTDTLTATIQVKYMPNCMAIDANGKIWVSCKGKGYTGYPASGDTEGHLICIDPSNNGIVKDFPLSTTSDHIDYMVIDSLRENLYYLSDDEVFKFSVNSSALNTTALINRSFYHIGYDNVTNYIYAANAGDYANNGWIIRYQVNGTPVDSFKAGIIPSYFCFN